MRNARYERLSRITEAVQGRISAARSPRGARSSRRMCTEHQTMSISCHQQIKLPATTACSGAVGLLQRKCACGGSPGPTAECKECREKRSQRHATNETGPTAAPLVVHDVLRSPGQPLDAATRNFMEPRFGHDFSLVRVHTGTQADESARAVSARAYTVGRDIVFAKGQYDPGIEQGRKLLAHELTHTIQQLSTASAAAAPPD